MQFIAQTYNATFLTSGNMCTAIGTISGEAEKNRQIRELKSFPQSFDEI